MKKRKSKLESLRDEYKTHCAQKIVAMEFERFVKDFKNRFNTMEKSVTTNNEVYVFTVISNYANKLIKLCESRADETLKLIKQINAKGYCDNDTKKESDDD